MVGSPMEERQQKILLTAASFWIKDAFLLLEDGGPLMFFTVRLTVFLKSYQPSQKHFSAPFHFPCDLFSYSSDVFVYFVVIFLL